MNKTFQALFVTLLVCILQVKDINGFMCARRRADRSSLRMVAGSDGSDFISELLAQGKYRTALKYVDSHPNLVLDENNLRLLLNNMDQTVDTDINPTHFYNMLKKQGKLSKFGVMNENYPVVDADLVDFEQILTETPMALASVGGVSLDAFRWVGQNAKTVETKDRRQSALIKRLIHVGIVAGSGALAWASGLECDAATGVGALTAAALAAVDNTVHVATVPAKDKMARIVHEVQKRTFQEDAAHHARREAAVFLLAYLAGSPVVHASLSPDAPNASKRVYYYDDAPKIDVRDCAEGLLTDASYGAGELDLAAVKRLAVVAMAPTAVDAITGKTPSVSKFARMLFALLFQKISDPTACRIHGKDLPVRLLPTLSAFGFVQAMLALKENDAALAAATAALLEGGGVGDVIIAMEANMPVVHPAYMRQQTRQAREREAQKLELAPSRALSTLVRARKIVNAGASSVGNGGATMTVDEEAAALGVDGVIELIPGTSRTYTREEIILPPNPSVWEVREVTKEVMNFKYKRDLAKFGRVTPRTRQEVQKINDDVMAALKVYQEQQGADKNSMLGPDAKKVQQQDGGIESERRKSIAAQATRQRQATARCLDQVGYSDEGPEWRRSGFGKSGLGAEAIMDGNRAVRAMTEQVLMVVAFVKMSILPRVDEATGKTVADAINGAWASPLPKHVRDRGAEGRTGGVGADGEEGKNMATMTPTERVEALTSIVTQCGRRSFVASVPIPDGTSSWNMDADEARNRPVAPHAPDTPTSLLQSHKGMANSEFEKAVMAGKSRIVQIDSRVDQLASKEEEERSALERAGHSGDERDRQSGFFLGEHAHEV